MSKKTGGAIIPLNSEWLGFISRQFALHNGWAWQWTHDHLRRKVSKLLKRRALPPIEALRTEFGWRAALSVVRHGGPLGPRKGRQSPISKNLLEESLKSYPPSGTYVDGGGDSFEVDQVRKVLVRLMEENGDSHLYPPWRGPENLIGPYVWSGYSPEALLARARAVYTAAFEAYFEVVAYWFPSFRGDLGLESQRPFRFVGMVKQAPDSDARYDDPELNYYREPNPGGPDFTVDLRLGDERARKTFLKQANDKYENGQIDMLGCSGLEIFDLDAAEKLTYSWLLDDLRRVHWVE